MLDLAHLGVPMPARALREILGGQTRALPDLAKLVGQRLPGLLSAGGRRGRHWSAESVERVVLVIGGEVPCRLEGSGAERGHLWGFAELVTDDASISVEDGEANKSAVKDPERVSRECKRRGECARKPANGFADGEIVFGRDAVLPSHVLVHGLGDQPDAVNLHASRHRVLYGFLEGPARRHLGLTAAFLPCQESRVVSDVPVMDFQMERRGRAFPDQFSEARLALAASVRPQPGGDGSLL